MVLSMMVGMIAGLVLWFPLGVLFGAMEVMLPTMFGGMLSGMVVGMWSSMSELGGYDSAAMGAVCGLVSIVFIWILNNSLRGLRSYSMEEQ
jgi:membrane protein implicated in regulation of membrane protease activity